MAPWTESEEKKVRRKVSPSCTMSVRMVVDFSARLHSAPSSHHVVDDGRGRQGHPRNCGHIWSSRGVETRRSTILLGQLNQYVTVKATNSC